MRHRNHRGRIQREVGHRTATLRNLAKGLVEHEQIETTSAKAYALRPFIETLITMAKRGTLHDRRLAFARLADKETVKKLFDVLGPRYANRPGGYTRSILTRRRMGDGAPMSIVQLLDAPAESAPATKDSAAPQATA